MRKAYGKARAKHNRPKRLPESVFCSGEIFEVVDFRCRESDARNLARKVAGKWTTWGRGYIVLKRSGGAA